MGGKNVRKKPKGFTLFELLAVLAILAIISGIAVPLVMKTIKNARIQNIENEMHNVMNCLKRMVVEMELRDDPCILATQTVVGIDPENAKENDIIRYQYPLMIDSPGINNYIDDYIDIPEYIGFTVSHVEGEPESIWINVSYPGIKENDPADHDDDEIVYYGGVSLADFSGENWPTPPSEGGNGRTYVEISEDEGWTYFNQREGTAGVPGVPVYINAVLYRVKMNNVVNSNHNHDNDYDYDCILRDGVRR